MKRFIVSIVAVLGLLAACTTVEESTTVSEARTDLSTLQATDGTRQVVLFRGNRIPSRGLDSLERAGATVVRLLPQVGVVIVEADAGFSERADGLRGVFDAGVVPAESLPATVDIALPNDAHETSALLEDGLLWGIERVQAPAAWAEGATGSPDTVIAIIDTGIASNHPDLASNLVYEDCYTSAGSFADEACVPYPSYSDHGTHVAGTVAANFGGGVVGVGPDLGLANYNTFEVIPECGVCSYSDSRWIAMLDAADRGFAAINMSLGGAGVFGGQGTNGLAAFYAAEKRVASYVASAGTVMVASAGNSATDANGTYIHFPGDIPDMINVSATGIRGVPETGEGWIPRFTDGARDAFAFYSNYGAAVDVSAPGGDCGQDGFCDPSTRSADWFEYLVLSSVVTPNPTCAATESCDVGYGWKGGTSMAAPHVAGVVGLVADEAPGLSARQVANRVVRSADRLGDRQLFGHGVVNAAEAIR